MADEFWHRWRSKYLHNLQYRRKWQGHAVNLKPGDLILMMKNDCPRNEWPTGIKQRTFASQDRKIRKVEIAVFKDNKCVVYLRPVTQLISLLENEWHSVCSDGYDVYWLISLSPLTCFFFYFLAKVRFNVDEWFYVKSEGECAALIPEIYVPAGFGFSFWFVFSLGIHVADLILSGYTTSFKNTHI